MLKFFQQLSEPLLRYRNCLAAGVFAAGGSFFGRMPSQLEEVKLPETLATAEFLYYFEFLLLRALPIVLMVLCNLLNWRFFLKALHGVDQTLTVTVLASAINYIFSHMLGVFIYHEPFRVVSVVGTSLIVVGLWQLCDSCESTDTNEKEE